MYYVKGMELLKNKKINLKDLISHIFQLEDFEKAFNIVLSKQFLKIIFKCY